MYFTFLDEAAIKQIEKNDEQAQGRPSAQGILAKEVTKLVHDDEGLEAAIRITKGLFSDAQYQRFAPH